MLIINLRAIISKVLLASGLTTSVVAPSAFGDDKYLINIVESIATAERRAQVSQFYTDVYSYVGIEPSFVFAPSDRGLLSVNNGEFDGEAIRFDETVKKYTNMLKVDAPITTLTPALFCLEEEKCKLTKGTLVGIQSGLKIVQAYCAATSTACTFDQSITYLARLLEDSMLDNLLLMRAGASQVVCLLNAKEIYYRELPQFEPIGFHYVHKSHQHLIPELEQAITLLSERYERKIWEANWLTQIENCNKRLIEIPADSTVRAN